MVRKKLRLCSRAAFGRLKATRPGGNEYSGWITQGKNSLRSRNLNPGGYLFSVTHSSTKFQWVFSSITTKFYEVRFYLSSSFTMNYNERAKKECFLDLMR